MGKTHCHLDPIFANLFFGADFSFYLSLKRDCLDFRQNFMLQALFATLFFIPFALFTRGFRRIGWHDAGRIVPVSLLLQSDGRLPHYSASSRRRHSSGTGRLH